MCTMYVIINKHFQCVSVEEMWSSSRNNYFEARTLARLMAWLKFETGKMMTILFVFEWAEETEAPTEECRRMGAHCVGIGVVSDHKMVMADNMSIFFFKYSLFPIPMGYFSCSAHRDVIIVLCRFPDEVCIVLWRVFYEKNAFNNDIFWHGWPLLNIYKYISCMLLLWRNSSKMKYEKSGHSAFFRLFAVVLSLCMMLFLPCFALFCFIYELDATWYI